MDAAQALALYRSFVGDRLSFVYSGNFHDEHSARLIAMGEEFLDQEGSSRTVRGKLAFIMVEAYQNIVRHRAPLPEPQRSGDGRSMFLLRCSATEQEVTTMDPVGEADAIRLRTDLDRLGQLDQKEMKQDFLRGLQSEQRSDRGGAGLGLLEMARRSGNPLRHAFAPIDTEHQLFTLQVLLGRAHAWRTDNAFAVRMQADMASHGLNLVYRGALPAALQEDLLRIIELDLEALPMVGDRTKHAFLLLMDAVAALEMRSTGPMVCVATHAGGSTLTMAMPLTAHAAAELQEAVSAVNALDPPALQRRYRDILLGRQEAKGGLELALMDLVRRSIGQLSLVELELEKAPLVILQVEL